MSKRLAKILFSISLTTMLISGAGCLLWIFLFGLVGIATAEVGSLARIAWVLHATFTASVTTLVCVVLTYGIDNPNPFDEEDR